MERKQRIVFIDGVEHHHCGKCKQYKLPEDFYANRRSLSGRGSYCKPCMKSYAAGENWVEWRKARYYKNPARTMWIEARRRARSAQLPFNIDIDDCSIPEVCPVLGIKLTQKGEGTRNDATPTLDKIIPDRGYTKGNVKVISWLANRIKSDCSDADVFEKIAAYIRANS